MEDIKKDKLFKVGDKLRANEYTLENTGSDTVTITSINLKNRIYHWECPVFWPEVGNFEKCVSGYRFEDAIPA